MSGKSKPLFDQAVSLLKQRGALISEIEEIKYDLEDSKRAVCKLNRHQFVIRTDYAYEGDTTLSYFLEVSPDRLLYPDDSLNVKILNLRDELIKFIPPPASISRSYGMTPNETSDHISDFPMRDPVGTTLILEFLLGWDDLDGSIHSKWSANSPMSKDGQFEAFEHVVRGKNFGPIDLEKQLIEALKFIDEAIELTSKFLER
jgi:hypothetical protein